MAVHGTRRRESVSWDYEGLLRLLTGLAAERSGLPLLRCYWYEGSADGRRTADHDALADLPGVKLRVTKTRPGREGVEGEIHRDLTTLAHNKAVSDAMVVSAEEELAQVISDVQDLGMRVTLLHIAADGNWTISRALRQECDDIVEISAAQLQPYVELISGAEPASGDERESAVLASYQQPNGSRVPAYAGTAPAASGYQAPPAIYTAPAVAEYQRPAPQLTRQGTAGPVGYDKISYDQAPRYDDLEDEARPAQQGQTAQPGQANGAASAASGDDPARDLLAGLAAMPVTRQEAHDPLREQPQPAAPDPAAEAAREAQVPQGVPERQEPPGSQETASRQEPPAQPGMELARPAFAARDPYGGQVTAPGPVGANPVPGGPVPGGPVPGGPVPAPPMQQPLAAPVPAAQADRAAGYQVPRGQEDVSGYSPGALRDPLPVDRDGFELAAGMAASARRLPARGAAPAGYQPGPQPVAAQVPGAQQVPGGQQGQQPGPGLSLTPTYTPAPNGGFGSPSAAAVTAVSAVPAVGPGPGSPASQAPAPAGQMPGAPAPGQQVPGGQQLPGTQMPAGQAPGAAGPAGLPGQMGGQMGQPPHGQPGPGQVVPFPGGPGAPGFSPAPGQPGLSLADAVQAAHEEGQEFGGSVARDAPALWLEAVLARKPRMPSDLEARLLQGSSLHIDFLLHDEVRHALRRGFWDALERARR
jgi:hypothetical protein